MKTATSTSAIRRTLFVLLFTIFCTMLPAFAFAATTIVYPSDAESTIAPERDFYVIGTGDDLATKGVKVELYSGKSAVGTPIRSLTYSPNYQLTLASCIPSLDLSNTGTIAVNDLVMPDLSFDSTIASSANDPRVKINVTNKNFAALILGGSDRGNALGISEATKLVAGDYYLQVTIGGNTASDPSDDEILSKHLVAGVTDDKVMSRFSPTAHTTAMQADATASGNDYRLYYDPFPGYWSPKNLNCIYYGGSLYTGSDVFLESMARWKLADGMEYEAGNVHFYIYNVSAGCATQAVEVAAIQRTHRIDTALFNKYYDIGEPTLTVNGETLTGTLVDMAKSDKLALTRAQTAADMGEDNEFATYLDHAGTVDTDYTDGVTCEVGQDVSFFGVTAPIQNADAQIVDDGKGAYTMQNLVSSISYTFEKDGQAIYQTSKPVTLYRDFESTWTHQQSIYEFKHDFSTGTTLEAGTYTVTAQATDSLGTAVAGGKEEFTLTIASTPAPTPQPSPESSTLPRTSDNMLPFVMLALMAGMAAIGIRRSVPAHRPTTRFAVKFPRNPRF